MTKHESRSLVAYESRSLLKMIMMHFAIYTSGVCLDYQLFKWAYGCHKRNRHHKGPPAHNDSDHAFASVIVVGILWHITINTIV